jgi:hypothetical protein
MPCRDQAKELADRARNELMTGAEARQVTE